VTRGWSAVTTWQQSAVTWLVRRGYLPVITPADGPEPSATAPNVRPSHSYEWLTECECGFYCKVTRARAKILKLNTTPLLWADPDLHLIQSSCLVWDVVTFTANKPTRCVQAFSLNPSTSQTDGQADNTTRKKSRTIILCYYSRSNNVSALFVL